MRFPTFAHACYTCMCWGFCTSVHSFFMHAIECTVHANIKPLCSHPLVMLGSTVCVYMHACVRACGRTCMCACVCACQSLAVCSTYLSNTYGFHRTKTLGPGAQSALRALARANMKIGRIGGFQMHPTPVCCCILSGNLLHVYCTY